LHLRAIHIAIGFIAKPPKQFVFGFSVIVGELLNCLVYETNHLFSPIKTLIDIDLDPLVRRECPSLGTTLALHAPSCNPHGEVDCGRKKEKYEENPKESAQINAKADDGNDE
jgi:hypothetical protein